MSKVQFIKTEAGEELAILPKAEYERLLQQAEDEDTQTRHLVRKAKDAIAAGQETLLPKSVVGRLAAGESPIRVLREWRDVTQLHLAFKTSLSQGHISDLEKGRRSGTPEALRRIANTLKVPLDLLVP